jgi:hypothetical protein
MSLSNETTSPTTAGHFAPRHEPEVLLRKTKTSRLRLEPAPQIDASLERTKFDIISRHCYTPERSSVDHYAWRLVPEDKLQIAARNFGRAAGIGKDLEAEFKDRLINLVEEFRAQQLQADLPEAPKRDYIAREGILNYLRSDEGVGPWVRAGLLTRPLLFRMAPKAYSALTHWERNPKHSLPEDIYIPNRSELVDQELTAAGLNVNDPTSMRKFQRLHSAAFKRRKAQQNQPEP